MTSPPGDGDPHQPVDDQADQPRPIESRTAHPEAPAQPQPGYWPPAPGQPGPVYVSTLPTHGGGLAAMIVGIVSLVLMCGYGVGLLGSPVAWWLGAKAMKEIDAAPGRYSGRGVAQAGFILGIIGTVLLALLIVAVIALVLIFVVVEASSGPNLPSESF